MPAIKEKEKTFEEMLLELESTVKELENGNVDLDLMIEKYAEAMKTAKICNDKLNNATEKVNNILASNGKLENFDIED